MSKKSLIFKVILGLILVLNVPLLWYLWAKLLCALEVDGISESSLRIFFFFLSFWVLTLVAVAIMVVLVKDWRFLAGSYLLAGIDLLVFLWRGGLLFPVGVVSATVITIGLLVVSRCIRNEVKNHVRFSAAHLLSPGFRSLGLFLSVAFSYYVFWVSRGWVADFYITVPDALIEVILERLPADFTEVTLGQSSDMYEESFDLTGFLQGKTALPEEFRPYFREGELPEELKEVLNSQGLPADLLESVLTLVEFDEEGMITEPMSESGMGILAQGLKSVTETQLNQVLKPYRGVLPIILAGSCFLSLFYLNIFIPVGGVIITWLLMKIMLLIKLIKIEKETIEVERLTIDGDTTG
ncbi:hypothetical protein KJ596_04070 [Patescibacteria group bacterium]|nr:hypothetical protein [Patescibacteria group bacterium]MBU1868763.1 hypothetical protein [Patescibacteria group bacterium]